MGGLGQIRPDGHGDRRDARIPEPNARRQDDAGRVTAKILGDLLQQWSRHCHTQYLAGTVVFPGSIDAGGHEVHVAMLLRPSRSYIPDRTVRVNRCTEMHSEDVMLAAGRLRLTWWDVDELSIKPGPAFPDA